MKNPAHSERSTDVGSDSDLANQAKLILNLRSEGINDPNLLRVMESIPRSLFTSGSSKFGDSYSSALPIECGQTVSAPNVVARMTSELELNENCTVFEVGSGSGYQTAILANLARHVYTTERFRTLVELAEQRLKSLSLTNVSFKHADGMLGLEEFAPFDRIILTAANPEIPQKLVDQLGPNGIMVLPVGASGDVQRLMKLIRKDDKLEEIFLCHVRFVPICEGIAKKL